MNLLAMRTPTKIAQTHSGGLSNAILVLSPVIMIYHSSNINRRKAAAGYLANKKEGIDLIFKHLLSAHGFVLMTLGMIL